MRVLKVLVAFVAFFVCTIIFISGAKPSNEKTQGLDRYRVSKVVDGDTIEIIRFGRTDKVRLIGVDTPETLNPRKPVQCFGKEASDYSRKLLENKDVIIEFDNLVGERDKYGRLLAYVWLDENTLFNNELVKQGYGHEYTYRSQEYKYRNLLKNSQSEAKASDLGLWSPLTCSGKTK